MLLSTVNASQSSPSLEKFKELLKDDQRVKVAGVDLDGILRGKVMAKSKFLSILESGFGFCSVIFGWDMHDKTYPEELSVSNAANGKTPLAVCPRGLLKQVTDRLAAIGWEAMCGAEFEFFNFKETPETLASKGHTEPDPLTPGMFGYSLLRPSLNQEYFYDVFDECKKFGVNIESFHTETGPGVFEAALSYDNATNMADMANLFKLSVKQLGMRQGIMPTFMAKPYGDQPGCSGHLHFSLRDIASRTNLFAAVPGENNSTTENAAWETNVPGVESMSQIMKWFTAGLLVGLPSIMAILAPNINSYKRLVENYWAPVTISWGIESRVSAIRVIGPPQCDAKGTRLEMRVGGADINPHLAIAACLAVGLFGIEHKLSMPVGPTTVEAEVDMAKGNVQVKAQRLPKSLKDSANAMLAPNSIARQVLGDEFVDHYGATRLHEYRLWESAVTTWETKRYFELV
ncbi:hypothetical protein BGZ94_008408 [Podila epigama]|nr:hypothetical protein BGZ94_008408 [Podila epigama]